MDNSNGKPRPRCGASGVKCTYIFVPKMEITGSELAACLELLMMGLGVLLGRMPPQACDLLYDGFDDETKRHWLAHEVSQIMPGHKLNELRLPPSVRL